MPSHTPKRTVRSVQRAGREREHQDEQRDGGRERMRCDEPSGRGEQRPDQAHRPSPRCAAITGKPCAACSGPCSSRAPDPGEMRSSVRDAGLSSLRREVCGRNRCSGGRSARRRTRSASRDTARGRAAALSAGRRGRRPPIRGIRSRPSDAPAPRVGPSSLDDASADPNSSGCPAANCTAQVAPCE